MWSRSNIFEFRMISDDLLIKQHLIRIPSLFVDYDTRNACIQTLFLFQ